MEIQPFKAYRFDPNVVGNPGDCIAPPYDVINADQQRQLYERNPYNVVRITRGKTAWGKFDLNIDMLTAKHQWKGFHHTTIEAKCKADTLATPVSWNLESVIFNNWAMISLSIFPRKSAIPYSVITKSLKWRGMVVCP